MFFKIVAIGFTPILTIKGKNEVFFIFIDAIIRENSK